MDWYLARDTPPINVSRKSGPYILSNLRDGQTDKQTNTTKNIDLSGGGNNGRELAILNLIKLIFFRRQPSVIPHILFYRDDLVI